MDGWWNVKTNGWAELDIEMMDGWMDGRLDRQVDGWTCA